MCNRHLHSATNESLIVLIQSCIRGSLTRKRLTSSKTFAQTARLAAIKIQVTNLLFLLSDESLTTLAALIYLVL